MSPATPTRMLPRTTSFARMRLAMRGACSERRVAGTPSVVDDAVRAECAAGVASLRFDPR